MFDDKYKGKYNKVVGMKTVSGRAAVDNGDEISVALRGMTVDNLADVAKDNGLWDRWELWADRSAGQKRMNLGNTLRWKLKRGDKVVVGDDELSMTA